MPGKNHGRKKASPLHAKSDKGLGNSRHNGPSRKDKARNHHMSLQEEANNTGRRHLLGDSDNRLRANRVVFVSGGDFDSNELTEAKQALPGDQVSPKASNEESSDKDFGRSDLTPKKIEVLVNETSVPVSQDEVYFSDVVGIKAPINTGFPPPIIRPSSPTPSDSSEEVILFAGRNEFGMPLTRAPVSPKTMPKVPALDPAYQQPKKLMKEVGIQLEMLSVSSDMEKPLDKRAQTIPTPMLDTPKSAKKRKRKKRTGVRSGDVDIEDVAISDEHLADYIENMRNNNTELPEVTDGENSPEKPENGYPQAELDGWGPSELLDFDNLSTSDEVNGELQYILSKRMRSGNTQYLVVCEGQTTDEARWYQQDILVKKRDQELIHLFEEEEKLVAKIVNDSNADDSSITTDTEEDRNDELDLLERQAALKTDEELAKFLQMQEDYNLSSQNFPDDIEDDYEDGEEDFADPPTISPLPLSYRYTGKKGPSSERPRFASASELADAYDGFDIMDHNRPSLSKRVKSQKRSLHLENVDPELANMLQTRWDADRAIKTKRKQERQQLLAEAKNYKSNNDLASIYRGGMTVKEVKMEMMEFFTSDEKSLSLPSMEKEKRYFVHHIAEIFGLKSKSAGSGFNRHPVLYKTKNTIVNPETIARITARLNRQRSYPRSSARHTGATPAFAGRGLRQFGAKGARGGRDNGAYSYQDGDVVGGLAPEIGSENRGRAMLEKMGWSTGTALGALDNKGILQPVLHVVKTSKAGLG
ncbi:MAG: hypothetical protein M1829_004836 [Trizodia sp. TS-e1964]|nr:MAG: hypothetical protein M1829_004836 [Trizodia sp. TS-e1964]